MIDFLEFLSGQSAMQLATTGGEGPHVATLFFALDPSPFRLLFLSARETRHIQEVLRDARAAAAIAASSPDIRLLRGAQLWGRVRTPGDPAACIARYLTKFKEAEAYLPDDVFLHLWEFRVDRARWIDNRRGFGFRSEWSFLHEGRNVGSAVG